MPKIISPFEKPEKKVINASTPPPRKEAERPHPKEEDTQARKPSKVEAKEKKIALKASEGRK